MFINVFFSFTTEKTYTCHFPNKSFVGIQTSASSLDDKITLTLGKETLWKFASRHILPIIFICRNNIAHYLENSTDFFLDLDRIGWGRRGSFSNWIQFFFFFFFPLNATTYFVVMFPNLHYMSIFGSCNLLHKLLKNIIPAHNNVNNKEVLCSFKSNNISNHMKSYRPILSQCFQCFILVFYRSNYSNAFISPHNNLKRQWMTTM